MLRVLWQFLTGGFGEDVFVFLGGAFGWLSGAMGNGVQNSV